MALVVGVVADPDHRAEAADGMDSGSFQSVIEKAVSAIASGGITATRSGENCIRRRTTGRFAVSPYCGRPPAPSVLNEFVENGE